MPSGHRPPIPPGYARVALSGTTQTHKWANVFYLQLTGSSILASDLNTLAADIATAWNTDIAPQVMPSVALTGVAIVYVPSVGNEVQGTWSGSHAGTQAGSDINDASSCYVVNLNISAYYRGGHPRWYIPGVQSGSVTNGSAVGGVILTNLAAAVGSFRTAVEGFTTTNISGVLIGTMSFQTGNSWRATPLFRHFTGQSVRTTLGSQRRRLKS